MKRAILFLLACILSLAQGVEVREEGEKALVKNMYFTAIFSRDRGGLLEELRTPNGVSLAGYSHIYTDWGIYQRGYVGSLEEKEGQMEIRREEEGVSIIAKGKLCSSTITPDPPIFYEVRYEIQDSPTLNVEVKVSPSQEGKLVNAFLAQVLIFHNVKQWRVKTVDGWVSEEVGGEGRRCWESREEFLDPMDPVLVLYTPQGKVEIKILHTDPQPQNIFLHSGERDIAFFIAFLDGGAERLQKQWRAIYRIDTGRSEEVEAH